MGSLKIEKCPEGHLFDIRNLVITFFDKWSNSSMFQTYILFKLNFMTLLLFGWLLCQGRKVFSLEIFIDFFFTRALIFYSLFSLLAFIYFLMSIRANFLQKLLQIFSISVKWKLTVLFVFQAEKTFKMIFYGI